MINKWIDTYAPKTLNDIYGHTKEISIAKEWLKSMYNNDSDKKVLVITGSSGIGKTCLARALLSDFKYQIIEHSSNDIKSKNSMLKIIKQSLEYGNVIDCFNSFTKPIGLIIDQFNILSSRGGEKMDSMIL